MLVVVTGSSGLIGTALVASLRGDGHKVIRLVRRTPSAPDERQWDPAARLLDPSVLNGAEIVVHLAGVGVGDKRWSESYKREILASRVDGTTTVAAAVAAMPTPPRALVSASAVGYYGDGGERALDETSPRGTGFLADVVTAWEDSTAAASDAGVRVSHLRTGLVLSPAGGLLGKVLPIFKLGAGARLGSGNQWMPWISLTDEVAAIRRIIDDDSLGGAVDLSAPAPVRNREFTQALAQAVHRPAVAFAPAFALRLALGDFADEGALVSQRMVPARLLDAGFDFHDTVLTAALAAML